MHLILLITVGFLGLSFIAAIALSRRSAFASIIASIVALGFAAFCAFGFLASFEPMDSPSWPWQLTYGILEVASLTTAFLGLKQSIKSKAR
ncbi:MAG: hypothetical protein QMC23_03265 [Rubritalea sp.]|jgi:uncharacterized membrane protein HdeD (DUF308 family)